jgi:hypothetical protein
LRPPEKAQTFQLALDLFAVRIRLIAALVAIILAAACLLTAVAVSLILLAALTFAALLLAALVWVATRLIVIGTLIVVGHGITP